jgi:hypothetical protein
MSAQPIQVSDPEKTWYYCYMQRPLSEYPWHVRAVVRWLHRRGWSSSDGTRRALCLAYGRSLAQDIIDHYPGGKAMPLPNATCVEEALPFEVGNYGMCLHADRKAQEHYIRRRFKNVNINSDLINETKELAAQLKRRRA